MNDPYLYDGTKVLRNLLNIQDQKALDLAEAEISRANMMLLYEKGFSNFTNDGLKEIHKIIFNGIYDWAGNFRIINIRKREELLAGKSVWYANHDDIDRDLKIGWDKINNISWNKLNLEELARNLSFTFPILWQAHPFRDGNTRTIVSLMTFFVEHHGYFIDKELLALSAGYVRNAFVLSSFGEHSEFEHLQNILFDALSDSPISKQKDFGKASSADKSSKYEKYYTTDYKPTPHEYREDNDE